VIDTTPTRRPGIDASRALLRGATVGDIASTRDRVDVTAPHGGPLEERLAEDGDLVSPGQPLVRLHSEGSA